MASVINAFTTTKYYKTTTIKIIGNEFRKLWFVSLKGVDGLNLSISGYSKVSTSQRKHNRGAWTEQPIGLSVIFLTPSRLSVKSYQSGLQRKQIQVWSNWRSRKH